MSFCVKDRTALFPVEKSSFPASQKNLLMVSNELWRSAWTAGRDLPTVYDTFIHLVENTAPEAYHDVTEVG